MKPVRAAHTSPEVRIDPRGIRLSRPAQGGGRAYDGILEFLISCDGSSPIPFDFEPVEGEKRRFAFKGSFPDPSAGIMCQVTLTPDSSTGGFKVLFEVENAGEDVSVRLEVRLHLPEEADPHWLIPGLFYGQNRLAHNDERYPGYSEIKRDPTGFWSNHWSFRSDRTALPAVFCTSGSGTAFIAVEEMSGQSSDSPQRMGMTSLALSSEDGQLSIGASLPAVEEPVRATSSSGEYSATSGSMLLERSVPMNWQFEVGLTIGDPSKRDVLLRALYTDRWGRFPLKPKVSSLEAEKLAIDGICSWHLDPERMVLREKSLGERNEEESRPFRVGERNGVFPAFVLLWYGRDCKDPAPVRVGHDLLDSVSQLLSPCGSFFEDVGDDTPKQSGARPARLAHARPVAEAVLFLIRAIRLEMQAHTAHPLWSSAVLSNLNYIVSAQRDDGAFPTAWSVETGDVAHWEGCDGMAWIAPLAAAGQVTGSREWLDAARRGALYYRSSVEEGFLTGALEFHEGIPTCAAAHWALISYILLYETDHDPTWLDLARRAAEFALTWRMSHNIEFAPASMLAQYSMATMGGDLLSVATPLLAPWGLLSYGEMIRLSALTEDDFYEQRAREGRLFASQLLARTDGEFNLRKGQTLGPISCTDGVIPKGLALKESLVWTNALIAYAALIERNQMISREALAGDAQSLAEMALRASGFIVKSDEELPETAASRRGRDSKSVVRQIPLTARHATPAPIIEQKVAAARSGEESTPVFPIGADAVAMGPTHKRQNSSGVIQMPSFPKEIHEPRRSTDDSQITDKRPAALSLRHPESDVLDSTPAANGEPKEAIPVGRIPGAPVGKDPNTNQDVFVASRAMGSGLARSHTSREESVAGSPKKPIIPVHRGYRVPDPVESSAASRTPTPPADAPEDSAQVPPISRLKDLPKWHVYQQALEDPESSGNDFGREDEESKTRKSGMNPKLPFEQRHSPLPSEDSQVGPPAAAKDDRRRGTTPSRSSDSSNPYRLPTGLEDNTPEKSDAESPADPSRIKWKIF